MDSQGPAPVIARGATLWVAVGALALALAPLFVAPAAAQAEPADAPTPVADLWSFHEPIVLDTTHREVPDEDEEIVAPDQVRLVSCQDRFVLALIPHANSPKDARNLTLWSEAPVGVWQKLAMVNGVVGDPTVLSLGRDVVVVANAREDKDKPRVWRITPLGEVSSSAVPMAAAAGGGTPAERRRRERQVVRFGTAAAQGESLAVFLLRGRNHGDSQEVLVVRSDDGGKTWLPERTCGSIGYFDTDEGINGLVGFGDGARSFGLLAADVKDGDDDVVWKPVLFTSGERAGTWRKEPLAWQDSLQQQMLRVPLGVARSGAGMLGLYGAFDPGGDQVRYCLTRSRDQGKTWSKGEPIGSDVSIFSMEHQVGFTASGSHVAVSYTEQGGDAEYGSGKLMISRNAGEEFESFPLDRYYRGQILECPAVAATSDRILMAAQVVIDPQSDPRTFLVVQEFSARSTPGEVPLEQRALLYFKRVVGDLGSEDFETRQRAGRQLGALGRSAKAPLLEAMRESRDPEVRMRLRLILGKLYPPCLRVN